ncbi:hypothetical protein RDWZM_007375 [Blomia tropicalis]|uniref:G-protein coupled receptors family 1 profile domain-containing protein n=1 Tax=Blomia tropicalis TaxID=40697 RepID=A0A9Q0RHY9_BLOTA|nr:hypothetical protein RDWZM_007375 [Blomia tropicalis]
MDEYHLQIASDSNDVKLNMNKSINISTMASIPSPEVNLPIVYTILETIVSICAILGNLLVILVFLQDRRLRKVTNFYIISLSIADLLVGAIGIPSAILTRIGIPHNSIRLCLTMLSLLVVLCTISILNLVAVSLDRYWAILHPLDYHKRISEKTALIIICLCWILGTMIGFLPLFGWNNGHLANDACYFIPIMNYDFLMFLYFATIVLPGLVMAFFYIRIYIVVIQQLSLNKVRQLSTTEVSWRKGNSNKATNLDGLSLSSHYCKNNKNSFKNVASQSEPNVKNQKQKRLQSTCSSQQLDQLETNRNRMLQCTDNNIYLNDNGTPNNSEIVADSLDSLSFSVSYLTENRPKCSKLNKTECHVLDEKGKSKQRKWISLLSIRSFNDCPPEDRNGKPRNTTPFSSINRSNHFNNNGNNSGGNKLSYSRREVKKAQKLFVIVVFFMLCWLPLYTSNTVQAFCHQCPVPSATWLDFLIILSHINSAGSPFLYAFHMKDFRQALRRLVFKGAINKRKLRDLRRQEMFSISGRRRCHTTESLSMGKIDRETRSAVECYQNTKASPYSLSGSVRKVDSTIRDQRLRSATKSLSNM